jgi:outer membrane lipoprotein-sorting protein
MVSGRNRDNRHRWCTAASFGLLLLLVLVSGCRVSRPVFVPIEDRLFIAFDASREEVLSKLEFSSGEVETISAGVIYIASSLMADDEGQIENRVYEDTRGALLVERPSLIRMEGNAMLGFLQAFEMVSNDREFRLSVPAENEFLVAVKDAEIEGDNPLLKLRPHLVLESLFVDIRDHLADPQIIDSFEEVTEGRRRFYVLSFIDVRGDSGRLIEKVWIDRLNLEPARKQLFRSDGAVDMEVDYLFHQEIEGMTFPQQVNIGRPADGAFLEIHFMTTRLNIGLDEANFVLTPPEGTVPRRVGEPRATLGSEEAGETESSGGDDSGISRVN